MNEFYIYGKNSVLEFIKNKPNKIKKIFILDNDKNFIYQLSDNIVQNIKIEILNHNKFANFIKKNFKENITHQNVVALIDEDFCYYSLDQLIVKDNVRSLVLLLDHIQDVGNFASIIRSAVAFNCDFIVLPKDRSVNINADVVKKSSGFASKIKLVRVNNLINVIKYFKEFGYWIYGADNDINSKNIFDIKFDTKSVIIFGNEHDGMSHNIIKNLDYVFKIQINSDVDSINVSQAASISMFWFSFNHKL